MFLRAVSRLLLWTFGWKVVSQEHPADKFVVLAAPHTSAWDFPFTIAVASLLGLEFSWLGKDALFRGWKGTFFRWMGGIPIDRSKSNNYVDYLAEEFQSREKLHLAIAAEGTRGYVEYWKSGFYHIAKAADVPIVLAYLDFKTKTGGLGPSINPTSPNEVMDQVRDFYKDIEAYHPDRFGPMKLRIEEAKEEARGALEEAKQAATATLEEAKLAATSRVEEARAAAGEAKEAAHARIGEARAAAGEAKDAAAARFEEAKGAAKEAANEAAEAAAEALGPKESTAS